MNAQELAGDGWAILERETLFLYLRHSPVPFFLSQHFQLYSTYFTHIWDAFHRQAQLNNQLGLFWGRMNEFPLGTGLPICAGACTNILYGPSHRTTYKILIHSIGSLWAKSKDLSFNFPNVWPFYCGIKPTSHVFIWLCNNPFKGQLYEAVVNGKRHLLH
jgi:hypothetical protein